MKYYSAFRKKEILPFDNTDEPSQSQEGKHCVIPRIGSI